MDKFKRYVVIERTFERIEKAARLVDLIKCLEKADRYNIIDFAVIGKPDYKPECSFISDAGLYLLKSHFTVVENMTEEVKT